MSKNALFSLAVSQIKENVFVMVIVVTAALKKVFLSCAVCFCMGQFFNANSKCKFSSFFFISLCCANFYIQICTGYFTTLRYVTYTYVHLTT